MNTSVKDKSLVFTKNEKAYVVYNKDFSSAVIVPVTVISVSKKYVKVNFDGEILNFSVKESNSFFLTDKNDRYLFCDEHKASEFAERRNLRRWICKHFSNGYSALSLEQLRKIKEIMSEK